MSEVSDESLEKVRDFLAIRSLDEPKGVKASIGEISSVTRLSPATIIKALRHLKQSGAIQVIPSKCSRFPNTYIYKGPIESYHKSPKQNSSSG